MVLVDNRLVLHAPVPLASPTRAHGGVLPDLPAANTYLGHAAAFRRPGGLDGLDASKEISLNPQQKLELLDQLLALTPEGKLDWQEEAPGTFAASLPRHFLALSSRDRNDVEPFTLMVEDAESRTVVDFVTTTTDQDRQPGDPPPPQAEDINRSLRSLYDMVRRRVLDLDASVEALFQDLGQMKEGEGSS
jgi:hypothetical protein